MPFFFSQKRIKKEKSACLHSCLGKVKEITKCFPTADKNENNLILANQSNS